MLWMRLNTSLSVFLCFLQAAKHKRTNLLRILGAWQLLGRGQIFTSLLAVVAFLCTPLAPVFAQSIVLNDGYIGQASGNKNNTLLNAQSFTSIGVSRVTFSQNNASGRFESLNNAVPGTLSIFDTTGELVVQYETTASWKLTNTSADGIGFTIFENSAFVSHDFGDFFTDFDVSNVLAAAPTGATLPIVVSGDVVSGNNAPINPEDLNAILDVQSALVPVFEESVNFVGSFTNDSYSFFYQEQSTVGEVLGQVAATDPDTSGNLSFSISSGNSNGWYAIQSQTGEISLTAVGAQSEANDFAAGTADHTVLIAVSDGVYTSYVVVTLNELANDAAGATSPESATIDGSQVSEDKMASEAGDTATLLLVLDAAPTANVTVSFTGDQCTYSPNPNPMTFTAANWDQVQAITVTAVDDADIEGEHSCTPVASFSSDDVNYNNLSDLTLPEVTITDNDGVVVQDDSSFGNEIGSLVSVSVLTNDSFAGASSPIVNLVDEEENFVSQVSVEGEGVWSVGAGNTVQFAPALGFVGDPTPIEYVITSANAAASNKATVYVDYLGIGAPDDLLAADDELVGQSSDGPVTVSPLVNDNGNVEGELVQSTLRLLDADNNQVEELTVENEGTWKVNATEGTVTFTPVQGFTGSSVNVNYYIETASGTPQTATIKILFIDPRGVVYNAETGAPISGVTLQFADASGTPLATSCLEEGQQPQRTGSDGRYAFDLSIACTDLDGKEFQILITDTPGYVLEPDSNGLQVGPLDPGTPSSETFKVVSYDAAPTASQVRRYYMSFTIGVNSKQIVNNHIPLAPLVSLIEDDLREVLRDDLAATLRQQSRQMAGYASSALRRLQEQSSRECELQINDLLAREPILFDTGSANIQQPSLATIDRIAAFLANCDGFAFEVGGHTDDVADEAFNLSLSQARASAVVSALHERGVPFDVLSAKGFGEGQPIADNVTEKGRQLNRRVEFVAIGRRSQNDECENSSETVRGLDATVNQDGMTANGEFWRETRDCRRDGWNIFEGNLSYLRTDQGMAQGMANLSYRTERFRTKDHLAGRFVGAYATNNDVTGLATGTIQGFGLNAGLYGARRYETGLYLDYYLGAAAGRHNFDLDFERTGGVVTADGFYTYVAAFAGAAVSGEMMLGEYKLMPRAGFEGAWSPGGDAEFEVSRGAIEQSDSLSTGEIVGLRVFGEQRFDDVLPEHSEKLAIAPMFFCDRSMGETPIACGAGLSVDFSYEDNVTGEQYGIELTGEKTKSSEMFGLQFDYSRPVLGGELSGTSSVSRNGQVSIGANYTLDF